MKTSKIIQICAARLSKNVLKGISGTTMSVSFEEGDQHFLVCCRDGYVNVMVSPCTCCHREGDEVTFSETKLFPFWEKGVASNASREAKGKRKYTRARTESFVACHKKAK